MLHHAALYMIGHLSSRYTSCDIQTLHFECRLSCQQRLVDRSTAVFNHADITRIYKACITIPRPFDVLSHLS